MAITWTCIISNGNPDQSRVNVSFKRVDDMTEKTFSVSYCQVEIKTQQQKLNLLNFVWAKWAKEKTKQTVIDNFVTNLEQLAKTNLEARET